METPGKSQWREFEAYHSPFDPCPPRKKYYIIPPNLIDVQPPGLKQYAPREALRRGTLWPDLYSPYRDGSLGAKS